MSKQHTIEVRLAGRPYGTQVLMDGQDISALVTRMVITADAKDRYTYIQLECESLEGVVTEFTGVVTEKPPPEAPDA